MPKLYENTEMDMIERLQDILQESRSFRGTEERGKELKELFEEWLREPYEIHVFYEKIKPMFVEQLKMRELFEEFIEQLPKAYPEQIKKLQEAQYQKSLLHTQNSEIHCIACSLQSSSPLLSLPREIRDKIWKEVATHTIIHVTKQSPNTSILGPTRSRPAAQNPPSYEFHTCISPFGNSSSACPPGIGDHVNCVHTSNEKSYICGQALALVCKQISMELPNWKSRFWEDNSFQFADLETADEYLFGKLGEEDRMRIGGLRVAVKWKEVMEKEGFGERDRFGSRCMADEVMADRWEGVCNYFGNAWDRRTLDMYPAPSDEPHLIKLPIYFYYSSCYYSNNYYRLWDRWQVGRGNTSWDIGISDLIYRGHPSFHISLSLPTSLELSSLTGTGRRKRDPEDMNPYGDYALRCLDAGQGWLVPLMQWRGAEDLEISFFDEKAVVRGDEKREAFVKEVKERLNPEENVVGPRIVPFFAGKPYGDGKGWYMGHGTPENTEWGNALSLDWT